MKLRQLMISLVLPISWRFSEKRKLAALQEFSATEFDSGWQSLYAMKYIENSLDRAYLFQHALEEFFHADLFNKLSKHYSSIPLVQPITGRNIIIKEHADKNQILDFLCYMYVGEQSVHEDFNYYTKAKIDKKIKNVFLKIYKDEEDHATESLQALKKFSDENKGNLRKYLFLNKLKRAYRQFSIFFSRIGELMLSLILSLSYFLFGLFFYKVLRRRLFLPNSEQMELLKRQTRFFKEIKP